MSKPIDPDQVRNSIKLLTAKAELWKQKHRAAVQKSKKEREFIASFSKMNLSDKSVVQEYLEAHKSYSDADEALILVQAAEFEAQLAIHRALLLECDPAEKLQTPGGLISI